MLTLSSKLARHHNISNEHHIHAIVGQSDCQYLRKAVQGCYGQIEGAGSDLSFIGLQHFCLAAFSHTIWFQMRPRQDTSIRQGLIDMLLSHVHTVTRKPWILHSQCGCTIGGICFAVDSTQMLQ